MTSRQTIRPSEAAWDESSDRYHKWIEWSEEDSTYTRSGSPAGVLLLAEEYEGLMETLDILSDPELSRAVRIGLEEATQGRLVPQEEVWDAMDDPGDG